VNLQFDCSRYNRILKFINVCTLSVFKEQMALRPQLFRVLDPEIGVKKTALITLGGHFLHQPPGDANVTKRIPQ